MFNFRFEIADGAHYSDDQAPLQTLVRPALFSLPHGLCGNISRQQCHDITGYLVLATGGGISRFSFAAKASAGIDVVDDVDDIRRDDVVIAIGIDKRLFVVRIVRQWAGTFGIDA